MPAKQRPNKFSAITTENGKDFWAFEEHLGVQIFREYGPRTPTLVRPGVLPKEGWLREYLILDAQLTGDASADYEAPGVQNTDIEVWIFRTLKAARGHIEAHKSK
jgi:hypothetical protein